MEYSYICGTERKGYLAFLPRKIQKEKRKEFLELKQDRMTVTKYELSKYARECVSTEAIMYKRFEDGLNEDIRLLVGILELNVFVVLVGRACKAKELSKEKRKAEFETRDSRKRSMSKPFQSSSMKLKDLYTRSNASAGYPNRYHRKFNGPKCQHCGRRHPGECRMNNWACFKCGSQDHFIRDCLEMTEKDSFQNARPSNTATRGRPLKNTGSGKSNRGVSKELTTRSEVRALARAYAIRTREYASSPDVIIGTFSFYDTNVVALIDPGLTHSYICMNLVSNKNLPVESTEFVIKVSNCLGKYVLVDKVCKSCPLMIRGHYFLANLMLLPFDEFDVILGTDSLTLHDVVVNCR
ncbi:Gag-Pol polyprotein [Gossypium australe]|uniref:Gag-Pol polyprotein n=1 Tax=Gossypium australe TaxID=47621 RepID=A0A5B6W9I4_9ROSI|nr:Gag-Pol polyprotein [Gossypium australe]